MNTLVMISETELEAQLSTITQKAVESVMAEIKHLHPPGREVMTLPQLADRWQVTERSILNWMKRDDSPLPVHYVGGNPRFHLSEVDEWSKMEARRRMGKSGENYTETIQ